jgi:endonuclease/exonuclease/phosphatase family metal-dependent hydrolase
MTFSAQLPVQVPVTLATYNIRRCFGTDRLLSPERIAQVIAGCDADIVALQEIDVGRLRSGGVDQARIIAGKLGFASHFHPAMRIAEEQYGDAILTRWPSRLVKVGLLPGSHRLWPSEPRGAIWIEAAIGGARLQVINTHFGLRRRERRAQAVALLGSDWLERCRPPYAFLGDLNSLPRGSVYRSFATLMRDAHLVGTRGRPAPTFPSRRPLLRIDHIFVSNDIEVTSAEVVRSPLTAVASDHLPLIAQLRIPAEEGRAGLADADEH